jgi:hypothetical protein
MTIYLNFRVSTQVLKLCQVVSVHAMKAHRGQEVGFVLGTR